MTNPISVLLVEDEPAKRERIVQLLDRLVPLPLKIETAETYEAARDELRERCYDLLILDLHIPAANQAPDPRFAIALLQSLVEGVLNSPTHIVGLTQHQESALAHSAEFERHLFHLEVFSYEDTVWAQRISDKIKYIFDARRAIVRYALGRPATDYVVLTARHTNEFLPVVNAVPWTQPPAMSHVMFPNHAIAHGTVTMRNGEQRSLVVACIQEMGIAAAASLATQMVFMFRPRLLSMLGMCCGFRVEGHNAGLHDVILADAVSCYDEGKYAGHDDRGIAKFIARGKTLSLRSDFAPLIASFVERHSEAVSRQISRHARHRRLATHKTMGGFVKKQVAVNCGHLLSGLNVISDELLISKIARQTPVAIGLDMETYGVYKGASLAPLYKPDFISIKGVADFGMQKDGGLFDRVQKSASHFSCVVFVELIEFLEDEGWRARRARQ